MPRTLVIRIPLPSAKSLRTIVAGLGVLWLVAPAVVASSDAQGERTKLLCRYPEREERHSVTVRGEIVDYYCFIEKGATGPGHRECGVKCVAGDICMGILTDEGDLYMISVNHLRAMDPKAFKGVPDPFARCRGLMAERVDLTGFAMARKGQRIIEIMGVKHLPSETPS